MEPKSIPPCLPGAGLCEGVWLQRPHPAFGHLLHLRGEGMARRVPKFQKSGAAQASLLHASGEGAQSADEVRLDLRLMWD
jgi:hypothetical protein